MKEPPNPTCPLCRGDMAKEEHVTVASGISAAVGGGMFDLAWVCTLCSAAHPIAIAKGGTDPQPLYRRGERTVGETPKELRRRRKRAAGVEGAAPGAPPKRPPKGPTK